MSKQHPSDTQPSNWNYIRAKIIKRDDHECQNCGRTSDEGTLSVHHILPVSEGGTEDEQNLITVCARCHDLLHRFGSGPRYPLSVLDGVEVSDEKDSNRTKMESPNPDLSGFYNLSKVRRDVLAATATYDSVVGARVAEELENQYEEPVTRPTIHTAFTRLEENGFIEIEESDSTHYQHSITEKGREALKEYHAWLTQCVVEM